MNEFTKITVNGREYGSVEEMPPDIREIYLKAMAAMPEENLPRASSGTVIRESITFNGRKYNSRDELPPEARALLAQMPEPGPDGKTMNFELKTEKTFRPQTFISERFDEGRRAPEEDPVVAWLLVKILVVVIAILLLLLGLKHFGW